MGSAASNYSVLGVSVIEVRHGLIADITDNQSAYSNGFRFCVEAYVLTGNEMDEYWVHLSL